MDEEGRMKGGKRILVVDDDEILRQSLTGQLQLNGEFVTGEADTAVAAMEAVNNTCWDALLLDIGLPDMDGRELCRLLRREGLRVPILMLTGQDTDTDEVLGLEAGANDYVTKPVRLAVLLARLRAQLRQHEQSEDAVFTIGPYVFQPAAKLLRHGDNRRIRLTEKETAILKYLFRAGERVVSRDVLLNEVWGYNADITTHTLETHVYRLRQKIEPDPSNATILVTAPGGYKVVP